MAWNLNDIQTQVAVELDQSNTPPEEGDADWNSRRSVINRALRDWAESYDWKSLLKVHNGIISTSTGNASLSLPANFKKIDGFTRIVPDGSNTYDLPVVNPSKNRNYVDSDRFVNILGNDRDNKVMFIHAGTLSSGASVQFTYWATPASLVSGSDVAEIPDPTFLVQRSLYYLHRAAEDGRFPEAKVEGDRILARMIENENTLGLSEIDRQVSVGGQKFVNFRVGSSG